MTDIKLPVRYDKGANFIVGDDGRWVADCDNLDKANFIVKCINEYERLRGEVAELTAELKEWRSGKWK